MKKIILTITLILTILFNSLSTNANVYNNLEDTNKISLITINTPATIKFFNGDNFDFGIRTTDKCLQNNIKYEINDSTLNIWIKDPESYNIESNDIKINIMNSDIIPIKILNPNLFIISSIYKKNNYEKNN